MVHWRAGPTVWVDVVAFDEAVVRGDRPAAVRSYGGDLLPGCDDEWAFAERERLRRMAVEALAGLASAAEAEGRSLTAGRMLPMLPPGVAGNGHAAGNGHGAGNGHVHAGDGHSH